MSKKSDISTDELLAALEEADAKAAPAPDTVKAEKGKASPAQLLAALEAEAEADAETQIGAAKAPAATGAASASKASKAAPKEDKELAAIEADEYQVDQIIDSFDDMKVGKNELELAASEFEEDYEPPPEDPWADIKRTFGWVLVSDIFVLIFLAAWVIVGIIFYYGFGSETLLTEFYKYWDPYFQSVLGVLFAARALGIAFNQITGEETKWMQ